VAARATACATPGSAGRPVARFVEEPAVFLPRLVDLAVEDPFDEMDATEFCGRGTGGVDHEQRELVVGRRLQLVGVVGEVGVGAGTALSRLFLRIDPSAGERERGPRGEVGVCFGARGAAPAAFGVLRFLQVAHRVVEAALV